MARLSKNPLGKIVSSGLKPICADKFALETFAHKNDQLFKQLKINLQNKKLVKKQKKCKKTGSPTRL